MPIRSKKVLVLGANAIGAQVIEQLVNEGYFVIAADGNKSAKGFNVASQELHVDLRDINKMLDFAQETAVDIVLPLNEFGVRAAGFISQRLNLRGPSLLSGIAGTSKAIMRRVCHERGIAQPNFKSSYDPEDIRKWALDFRLPFVIKPSNSGGGGRGISIVRDRCEVEEAVRRASDFSSNDEILIEEFMEGQEFTVDSFVRESRVVSIVTSIKQRHPVAEHVAVRLDFPGPLDERSRSEIAKFQQEIADAFSVRNGLIHTEIIRVKASQNFKLVEFGLRGGGGHIFSRIIGIMLGLDGPATFCKMAGGDSLKFPDDPGTGFRAIYSFYSETVSETLIHEFESKFGDEGVSSDFGNLIQVIPGNSAPRNSLDRVSYSLVWGLDHLKVGQAAEWISERLKA